MTIKIDLPDRLIQQLNAQKISEKEVNAVVVAALEIWLSKPEEQKRGQFAESAVPFTQRLIAQNRELFELLAQR